jgi:hypothetical protein
MKTQLLTPSLFPSGGEGWGEGTIVKRLNAFVLITFVLKHSFEPLRVLFDFRMILLNRRLV